MLNGTDALISDVAQGRILIACQGACDCRLSIIDCLLIMFFGILAFEGSRWLMIDKRTGKYRWEK